MPKYKPVPAPTFDNESRPGPLPLRKVEHGPLPKRNSPIGRLMRKMIKDRRSKPQAPPHPLHRKEMWNT